MSDENTELAKDLDWCLTKIEKLQTRAFTSERLLMKIISSTLFCLLFKSLHAEIHKHLEKTCIEETNEWEAFIERIKTDRNNEQIKKDA